MNSETPAPRPKIFRWIVLLAVLILAAAGLLVYIQRYSPLSRDWVVNALQQHYNCEVELKTFSASVFPMVRISGEGLVLKRKGRADLPPLASISSFSVEGSWLGVLRHPKHFTQVRLGGLVLNVPPRQNQAYSEKKHQVSPFVLDRVVADGTTLNIFSARRDKPPHEFDIQKLRLQSAGIGQPMTFQATLTNPKPVGQIVSSGRFGPWEADEPSLTPVSGKYTFRNADLSTIRGIAGILSSEGSYQGVLKEIKVEGETDTPNFSLGITGNKVHLKTHFNAIVGGTNGDTILRPVDAQLIGSRIVARGEVVKAAGKQGWTILLQVTAGPARLEDLLRLAVKSATPPIRGAVHIESKFDLPRGEEDIARRLKLDGSFVTQSVRFTDQELEGKITDLSRRGRGQPHNFSSPSAVANMSGRFILANGVMNFSTLSFSVPGALVNLHGTYGLIDHAVDFRGTARLQAKISQTTTGLKSILLKPIDPLFKGEGAGAVLPIKITGTGEHPSLELEFGKIFHKSK